MATQMFTCVQHTDTQMATQMFTCVQHTDTQMATQMVSHSQCSESSPRKKKFVVGVFVIYCTFKSESVRACEQHSSPA